ncbi:MAG: ferric iron uptake transcriptional regulator [Porticoccaceae bacterium]
MSNESQELKDAGLKVTHPRMLILKVLEDTKQRHMSAEDVYRSLMETGQDVGIATIYRVLTQFESAGLVKKLNFDHGPAVYEIAIGGHHDHMVCMETGRVIEFQSKEIEALQIKIAHKHGYELVCHSLVLYVRPKA